MTKYKYTRKEAIELARVKGYGLTSLGLLLLKKESKEEYSQKIMMEQLDKSGKECKHKFDAYGGDGGMYCSKCSKRRPIKDSKPIKEIEIPMVLIHPKKNDIVDFITCDIVPKLNEIITKLNKRI